MEKLCRQTSEICSSRSCTEACPAKSSKGYSTSLHHREILYCLLMWMTIPAVADRRIAPGCHLHSFHPTGYSRPGDILIGGIFPVHVDKVYLPDSSATTFHSTPLRLTCQKFSVQNFQWLQAMVFAIEQINETPDILPNITLGFQIYDSCTMLQLVLQETLQILTGKEEFLPNYRCQQHLPLAGIVGDAGSSNSILVARVLGLYGYPQISYFSTSPLLSDRSQFPSFFRTIPSDDFQSRGLAQLLLHFGWTWVGLLATDNDYGKLGVQIIRQELLKAGACVAFSESIITNRLDKNAFHIAKVTKASSAMVIIVFSSEASLVPVMDEMVRQNVIGKTWIASESWSTSALLSTARYQKVLIGLIGFATYSGEMLGFEEHLTSMRPSKFSEGLFIKEFWEIIFNCSWLDNNTLPSLSESRNGRCTGDEKLTMLDGIFNELSNPRVTYNVYSAVYAIALALHDLNTCTSINGSFVCATCVEIRDFQPWQIPVSVCSPNCQPGFRKVAIPGEQLCCFHCISCPPGEVTNKTGSPECLRCPWDHWPNKGKERCTQKTIEFFSYEDPLGATLATASISSSTIPLAILGVFIHYRNTPIVRANNCSLSYLLLVSLTLCFLCSLAFIGYPSSEKCLLRQVAFGITFSLCVSCVLAKTIVVVIAFSATKPNSDLRAWAGPKLSYLVVCIGTLIPTLMCVSWLILAPPKSEYNTQSQPGKIILECNEGSPIAFWCMLGYLGLLAAISFIVAFLARKLPDNFNEAKFITFSMLAFLSVWLSFVPAYLSTRGKYMVAMEIFAISSSSWSMISCIFFTKCYKILLRPETNTKHHMLGREKAQRI
ncbi:extracellular calcium-sensing receptor-like [Pleurodeles waltl]|uniref:extracellular calcium-sensing receptor-like n=1 Tax=Pleurodeles waltl TaxID=8319 RepID=UPI0037095EAE